MPVRIRTPVRNQNAPVLSTSRSTIVAASEHYLELVRTEAQRMNAHARRHGAVSVVDQATIELATDPIVVDRPATPISDIGTSRSIQL